MWNDIRFGARMLVKAPAFTIIAVLALALGIGASTTMFSVVNALLLKPWPYIQDQNRVLYVSEYFPKGGEHDNGVAYPDYLDFRHQVTTLEGFGTSSVATMILSGGEKPDRYLGSFISADAFSFLGVKPILGRIFRADEDQQGAAPVALLGYEVWKNHFGSDPNVINRVVPINGKPVAIVGVMPKGWRSPGGSGCDCSSNLAGETVARGNEERTWFAIRGLGYRSGLALDPGGNPLLDPGQFRLARFHLCPRARPWVGCFVRTFPGAASLSS